MPNPTPSKRSIERVNNKFCPCCRTDIALAFDRLREETFDEVRGIVGNAFRIAYDGENEHAKICYIKIDQAIRLKLKGSPEGDTNRDSSKTASKGGEE